MLVDAQSRTATRPKSVAPLGNAPNMPADPVRASSRRFSTNPALHVDLLQMLASVVIGLRDQDAAHKHERRAFGIELPESIFNVGRWGS